MQMIRPVLCFLLVLSSAVPSTSQQMKKVLTNADVVKLEKAKMADDTIIRAIQHSKTNFDTSPDALIALKNAGVDESVIVAMLDSSPKAEVHLAAPSKQLSIPTISENLSDAFAKAGLKALHGIEGTLAKPSLDNGSITVPRQIQELIDNADAEARTEEERTVVKALSKFFLGRLSDNLQREIIMLKFGTYSEERRIQAEKSLEKDPENIEMNAGEAACSAALNVILRNRHFDAFPEACNVNASSGLVGDKSGAK